MMADFMFPFDKKHHFVFFMKTCINLRNVHKSTLAEKESVYNIRLLNLGKQDKWAMLK